MENPEHKCSFCGKAVSEVKKMVIGAEGCICDYCVAMHYVILEDGGMDMIQTAQKVKNGLAKLDDQK